MLTMSAPVLADFLHVAHHMREDERVQWLALTGAEAYSPDALALAAASGSGYRWAVRDEGRAVLIGGFDEVRPGVYEAWQMSTADSWARWWRSFTRISRRLIEWMLGAGAHRVQVVAQACRLHTHAWYSRSLGLNCEGRLAGYYADGTDGLMFARCS